MGIFFDGFGVDKVESPRVVRRDHLFYDDVADVSGAPRSTNNGNASRAEEAVNLSFDAFSYWLHG
jgi:hypothetical protein